MGHEKIASDANWSSSRWRDGQSPSGAAQCRARLSIQRPAGASPASSTVVSLAESKIFVHCAAPDQAQRKERPMRHHLRDRQTECLSTQAPRALQLELPLLAPASQLRSHEPSKRRRSRLSPDRLAKFEEMRARRGTVPASCAENSDGNFLRQGHCFKLTTSLMSFIKADISGKRGQSATHVATLPSLETCKEPEPSSGCSHVRRGSP